MNSLYFYLSSTDGCDSLETVFSKPLAMIKHELDIRDHKAFRFKWEKKILCLVWFS